MLADALVRAGSKREEAFGESGRASPGEAGGTKRIRVGPVGGESLRDVGGDDEARVARNRTAAERIRFPDTSLRDPYGGKEPQRLLQRGVKPDQAGQIGEARIAAGEHGGELGLDRGELGLMLVEQR